MSNEYIYILIGASTSLLIGVIESFSKDGNWLERHKWIKIIPLTVGIICSIASEEIKPTTVTKYIPYPVNKTTVLKDTVTKYQPDPNIKPIISFLAGESGQPELQRVNDSLVKTVATLMVVNDGVIFNVSFGLVAYKIKDGKKYMIRRSNYSLPNKTFINKIGAESINPTLKFGYNDTVIYRVFVKYAWEKNKNNKDTFDFFIFNDNLENAVGVIPADTLNKYLVLK